MSPCADVHVDVEGVRAVSRDAAIAATVLPSACAGLTRWHLQPTQPFRLTVHATVDSFVTATGQTTDSLRAWTSWDHIHLLTLSSWRQQDRPALMRRLAHEVCHIGLLQRLGDEDRARDARIPRALTEGLCSVVADQGGERLGKDDVVAALAGGRSMNFVDDSPFAYAVAHHVVAAIARCRGDDALVRLFDKVAAGATVPAALGRPPLAFLAGCDDGKEAADGAGR